MASSDSSLSIADQAALWAVEAASGEMAAEDAAKLEAWLAVDRRHQGAYARAAAILRAMEDAVIDGHVAPASRMRVPANENDAEVHPSRRRLFGWSRSALAGGAAVAASIVVMVAVGVPVRHLLGPSQLATRDEVVTLRDGSVVTIERGSKIEVALSHDIRRITLASGKATFKVAKDKTRPFVVRSGGVYAQATGTVYSVERFGAKGGTVKVQEGTVLVWPQDERDQAVLVHAHGMVTLDPGPGLPARPSESAPRRLPPPELAQISLDNVPIHEGVLRFNRVNTTKIVLADDRIGDIRIIGLYRSNDPEQFANAVAAISGARIEHGKDIIVIKSD